MPPDHGRCRRPWRSGRLTRSVPSQKRSRYLRQELHAAPDHPGTYRLARDRRHRRTRAEPPTPLGRRFFSCPDHPTTGSNLEGHRRPIAHPQPGSLRRRRHVRPSRRGHPSRLRPDPGVVGAPHPGPPRAGRRPRRRGLRLGHRQGRGVHGHQRAGRDQPGHRPVRRLHGLGAAGGHHRPGAELGDRLRRLPGGRHHRHHHARDQAQRAGAGHRPDPRRGGRGVPHRRLRPSRPGPGRRAQGHPPGHHRVELAVHHRAARLPAGDPAQRQAGPGGGGPAAGGPAAGAVRRRRRDQGRGRGRPARAGRGRPGPRSPPP